MPKSKLKPFDKNFFGGASTSAYQCEGANREDGKELSVQDDPNSPFRKLTALKHPVSDFSVAVDHYHRFSEDIALMAQLGLKMYRFSIAGSRIYPDGERLNPKGIEHYRQVFQCLKKHHIEPLVTIYHFDLPLALAQKGGWTNRELILPAGNRYVKTLFQEFGQDVNYGITINEQNMLTMVDLALIFKERPDYQKNFQRIGKTNCLMFLAHASAVNLCRQMCPNAKIGPAPNICQIYPKTCNPQDVLASHNLASLLHYWYLDTYVYGTFPQLVVNFFQNFGTDCTISFADQETLKMAKPDFLAFNYYASLTSSYEPKENDRSELSFHIPNFGGFADNPYLPKTKYRGTIDPLGFRLTFYDLYERYRLPLIVTENGFANEERLSSDHRIHDEERISYLRAHITEMNSSYHDGVPVFGYCVGSALDLLSTHNGISKRYGLIYVDRDETDLKDLKRYPKDSFYWYQKVITSNGEDLA